MCGINGFNFVDRNLIKRMNDSLKHRGPDGEGVFLDKNVSLGHRRLAIIDLSEKGKQPMTYSHNGRKAVITFNGEIYNFQEIKDELIKKGYEFKSKTDTEVIVASYLEWGFDCVKRFNGMWAFCIYDLEKKILFLSRDRVGKKPLYYYFDGKKFIFSSEIKGILCHQIEKKIKKESIDFFLSLGFIPAPFSIYERIKKLEARQNLIFDLKNKKLSEDYYYDWPDYSPSLSKEEAIKKGKELIKDSVKIRLISDVSLGAFLSGGLDSSTIVNEMKNFLTKEEIYTFSIGFEEGIDETPEINIISKHLGVKNFHKYFKEEDFDFLLKEIFYNFDEPFADPSMFPSSFLSEMARKKIIVSLSGDGGDEVFGGYPRYLIAKQIEFLKKFPKSVRKLFFILTKGTKIGEGIRLSLLPKEEFYSEARKEVYKPKLVKKFLKNLLRKCLKKTNGNLPEAVRLMDIYLYTLPDNFLLKVDRSSMKNSLEVRCPLLDYRLVEYSMNLPTKYKIGFFKNKLLFREMIKKDLPKKILKKKKRGFTPPINIFIEKTKIKKEILFGLKKLEEKEIISKEWRRFFEKIFEKKDLISKNYKIRLYFLIRWAKYWKII